MCSRPTWNNETNRFVLPLEINILNLCLWAADDPISRACSSVGSKILALSALWMPR
jgi:hypothetical protein